MIVNVRAIGWEKQVWSSASSLTQGMERHNPREVSMGNIGAVLTHSPESMERCVLVMASTLENQGRESCGSWCSCVGICRHRSRRLSVFFLRSLWLEVCSRVGYMLLRAGEPLKAVISCHCTGCRGCQGHAAECQGGPGPCDGAHGAFNTELQPVYSGASTDT